MQRLLPLTVAAWALVAVAPANAADPVALVEDIQGAPAAGLSVMDYLYADQRVDLGTGRLVVSFLDGCARVTFTGGAVQIGKDSTRWTGRGTAEQLPCKRSRTNVAADAREAGGVVARLALFKPGEWAEQVTRSRTPLFKWDPARLRGPVQLRVHDMDAAQPAQVYQAQADGGLHSYPASAPALQVGRPYRLSVQSASGTSEVLFSIDPDLDGPETAVTRTVRVGP